MPRLSRSRANGESLVLDLPSSSMQGYDENRIDICSSARCVRSMALHLVIIFPTGTQELFLQTGGQKQGEAFVNLPLI